MGEGINNTFTLAHIEKAMEIIDNDPNTVRLEDCETIELPKRVWDLMNEVANIVTKDMPNG